MAKTARTTISCGFGSLMDIDKLILVGSGHGSGIRFGSLMDIDKLIRRFYLEQDGESFGSLMDIDKLIRGEGKADV